MIKANDKGYAHARKLIFDGQTDKNSTWDFNLADRNKIFNSVGENWNEFGKWFLCIDDDFPENSFEHWREPFGKKGKVYKEGILSAATTENAPKLLSLIEETNAQMSINDDDEILFYGVLGWEDTAKELVSMIKDVGKTQDRVKLRIDSPGGDFSEGLAVYNYMRTFGRPIDVIIDGMARSAASLIACGGTVTMHAASAFHIHNPWSGAVGDYRDMGAAAKDLDKFSELAAGVYARKSGRSLREVRQWMDEDTFFTAQEAYDLGFCDNLLSSSANMYSKYDNLLQRSKTKMHEKVKEVLGDLKLMVDDKGVERIKAAIENSYKDENQTLKDKVTALGKTSVMAKLTAQVGEKPAIMLGKIHSSIPEDTFNGLVTMITDMQKVIEDLGGARGDDTHEIPTVTDDAVMIKANKIAEEEKVPVSEALEILADREPELIANWR